MALYLIGLNLDSPTAHYRVERGFLNELLRGIYIDAVDNADDVVLQLQGISVLLSKHMLW